MLFIFSHIFKVLDDYIFVIGGFNGITTIYNVECYDAEKNEWYMHLSNY